MVISVIRDEVDRVIKEAEYIINNGPLAKKLEICQFLRERFDILQAVMLNSGYLKEMLYRAVTAYPYEDTFGRLLVKLGLSTAEEIEEIQVKERSLHRRIFIQQQTLRYWATGSQIATMSERKEWVFMVYDHILSNGIRGSPELLLSCFRASYPHNHTLNSILKESEASLIEKLSLIDFAKAKLLSRIIQKEITNPNSRLSKKEKKELLEISNSVSQKFPDTDWLDWINRIFLLIFPLLAIGAFIWRLLQGEVLSSTLLASFILPLAGLIYSQKEDNSQLKSQGLSLQEMAAKIKLSQPVELIKWGLFDHILRMPIWYEGAQVGEFILRQDGLDNRYIWIESFTLIDKFKDKRNFYYNVGLAKIRRHYSIQSSPRIVLVKETSPMASKVKTTGPKEFPLPGQLELKPYRIKEIPASSLFPIREELELSEADMVWNDLVKNLQSSLKPLPEKRRIYIPTRRMRHKKGEYKIDGSLYRCSLQAMPPRE